MASVLKYLKPEKVPISLLITLALVITLFSRRKISFGLKKKNSESVNRPLKFNVAVECDKTMQAKFIP